MQALRRRSPDDGRQLALGIRRQWVRRAEGDASEQVTVAARPAQERSAPGTGRAGRRTRRYPASMAAAGLAGRVVASPAAGTPADGPPLRDP